MGQFLPWQGAVWVTKEVCWNAQAVPDLKKLTQTLGNIIKSIIWLKKLCFKVKWFHPPTSWNSLDWIPWGFTFWLFTLMLPFVLTFLFFNFFNFFILGIPVFRCLIERTLKQLAFASTPNKCGSTIPLGNVPETVLIQGTVSLRRPLVGRVFYPSIVQGLLACLEQEEGRPRLAKLCAENNCRLLCWGLWAPQLCVNFLHSAPYHAQSPNPMCLTAHQLSCFNFP